MQENRITRRDMERALTETAWQWYLKGRKVQYDCTSLGMDVASRGHGGPCRCTFEQTPEDATSHSSVFTVCSDYIWNVYRNAFDYSIFGNVLNAYTAAYFLMTEQPEDMAVIRWVPERYKTCQEVADELKEDWGLTLDFKVSDDKRADLKTVQDFILNWKDNLRPGDIFLATGHVELYIGNGRLLDAGGGTYDMETGLDKIEPKGSVNYLHWVQDVFVTGQDLIGGNFFRLGRDTSVFGRDIKFFAVIRPFNAMMLPGGTDDPGDDILDPNYKVPDWDLLQLRDFRKSGFGITPATASRLQYPAMEIDRTVNITPYGTAAKGETLRYTVKITNRSSDPAYMEVCTAEQGSDYNGEDYVNLVVKEKVPAGTKLNRVLGKAEVKGDEITWTVNIPVGGSLELTYFVDVTGEIGTEIVSGGGFVADIPSNTIVNRIGGARFDKDHMAYLFNSGSTPLAKWEEINGMSADPRRMDWVNAYYQQILKVGVQLPPVEELVDALFEPFHRTFPHGFLGAKNTPVESVGLRLRKEVKPEYQYLQDMLVRGFYGGRYVYSDDYALEPRIREVLSGYMEPGDIMVSVKLTPEENGEPRTIERVSVMLHRFGDSKIGTDDVEGMHKFAGDAGLTEANKGFSYDIFFVLRPRQHYENINTL